jgi:hypothetical protein
MITAWFLSVFTGLLDWVIGLFGTADPPAYLSTVSTFVVGLIDSVQGLGVWIPWAFMLVVAGINLTLWAVFLGVKALRWVIGILPTMGGG